MEIKQRIELAARLLGLTKEFVEKNYSVESEDLLYVSIPEKGGCAMLIDSNGEVLYADSSISFSNHIKAYKEGVRTPLSAFEQKE